MLSSLSRSTVLAVVTIGLFGCPSLDDRTSIERIIRSAIDAAKARKPNDMLQRVSEDFKGPNGADRRQIKRMLVGRLIGDRWLRVFERSLEVTVDGDQAQAVLRVVLAQGNKIREAKDLVPTDASAARFDLVMNKRDGRWWIVGADYTPEELSLDGIGLP